MDTYVEIIKTDGTLERHQLIGEQITLGRASKAGVSLPLLEELEAEHLMLSPRPDGCWVAVSKRARVPALLRGQPFEHGVLPWGAEIQIGSVRLRFTDKLPPVKKESKKGNPMVAVGALALMAVAGIVFFSGAEEQIPPPPSVPPPELFEAKVTCSEQGPLAVSRAIEAAEYAAAKSERYAFEAQDGIVAVQKYAEAHACYAAAGYADDAKRMKAKHDALKEQIEEDYRTRRLRLERALANKRVDEALHETRALLSMVRHTKGDYKATLVQRERVYQLLLDKRKNAGK